MPWVALLGFVRLSINPKVLTQPLSLSEALDQVREWLALPNVVVLEPGIDHHVHFTAACLSVKAGPNLFLHSRFNSLHAFPIRHPALL